VKPLLIFLSVLCLIPWDRPAQAIDPGTAQGTLQVNEETIPLSQAYTHLHDNAEGLLDRPKELRVLLVDREVPQETLAGISVVEPLDEMVKDGRVRGLLLRMDPAANSYVLVTLLYPPADPREALMTQTISATGHKAMKSLQIAGNRVMGEIEQQQSTESSFAGFPKVGYSIRFSAPLFHELPITADIKGEAARRSPQGLALREKARALAKGDIGAVRRLSTDRANRRLDNFISRGAEEYMTMIKQEGAEMEVSLKSIRRVVERGDRAVVIWKGDSWITMFRKGGEWKID
jgi:hypothetical protein